MGSIIRIADWFDIPLILHTSDTVDFYHPKVVQASMGSHVRVGAVDLEKNEQRLNNFNWYAMALGGEKLSDQSLSPGIIMIGNEGSGIRDLWLQKANKIVSIESLGSAESLNAAVACGICCYQLIIP